MRMYWLEGIRHPNLDPKAPPPEPLWRLPIQALDDTMARELATSLEPILARGDGAAMEIRVSQKVMRVEALPTEVEPTG